MEKQGKKLSELRVVDLRQILDKRGLEKTGNKSTLIERLSKSLTDEGHDPNTYIYTPDGNEAANDSVLSETSQAEELTDVSESKETLAEDEAEALPTGDDNEEGNEELNHTGRSGEEDLSYQDADKMVEVDSLAADQMESQNTPQELSEEADTGTATGEEEVSSETANKEHGSQKEQTDEGDVGDVEQVEPVQTSTDDRDGDEENAADDAVVDTTQADTTQTKTNEAVSADTSAVEVSTSVPSSNEDSMKDSKLVDPVTSSALDTDGTFVVHIDESDTNLDYDLNVDKPEERDAPTPTKDESMDVDATDIVQSNGDASAEKQPESDAKDSSTTSGQASKSSTDSRTDTPKKDAKDLAASQNLWISGLSSLTRATDLKAVFSKHGKVIGAKVVTNANRPGAKCYGYVTMSSSEEAAKCIQNLHRTELHGRMISVEKAKTDPAAQARAASARKPATVDDKKKEEAASASQETVAAAKDEGRTGSTSHRTEDKGRHSDRHRPRSSGAASTAKKDGETTKEGEKKPEEKKEKSEAERKADEYIDREKRRLRLMERRARDDDYRRRNALLKEKRDLAEQTRRMRMEEERLNREREKLRMDREKVRIEEMKLESLQGERSRLENQLIELRQRVDREREELKRVETLRLEEMRRSTAVKRSYDSSSASRSSGGGRYDDGWESKRPATNDRYTSGSVDRRSSGVSTDRSYSDRRAPQEMERRSAKDVPAERSSGRGDDRYSSRTGGGSERRGDYPQADRTRDVSSRSMQDSRGVSRSYHEGSSRRSGGSSDRGGGWSGSSGAPSLLSGPSNELFSGAAVQAAGMMMNAAMSRGSGTTANGTSSRYSGAGGGSGYGGNRRY